MPKSKRMTGLPVTLLDHGYTGAPAYRYIRDFAVDGVFPAEQRNGIWYFAEADVPAIAAALGLKRAEAPRRAA